MISFCILHFAFCILHLSPLRAWKHSPTSTHKYRLPSPLRAWKHSPTSTHKHRLSSPPPGLGEGANAKQSGVGAGAGLRHPKFSTIVVLIWLWNHSRLKKLSSVVQNPMSPVGAIINRPPRQHQQKQSRAIPFARLCWLGKSDTMGRSSI